MTKRSLDEAKESSTEGDPSEDLPVGAQEDHESPLTYTGTVRRLLTAHGQNLWVEPGDKVPRIFDHPELKEI